MLDYERALSRWESEGGGPRLMAQHDLRDRKAPARRRDDAGAQVPSSFRLASPEAPGGGEAGRE